MQLEWLGDYRELIEKIIKYGNAYARTYHKPHTYGTSCTLSAAELQTLECIIENEDNCYNMGELSSRLGILPSAFSKNVKEMLRKGLLEKFHTRSNKKNIIIRATDYGRDVYSDYCKYMESSFSIIFSKLNGISKENLKQIADVMDYLAQGVLDEPEDSNAQIELVKIENK